MPFYTQEEIPTPGGMAQFAKQYDPSLAVIFSENIMEGFRDITPMLAKSLTELQYAGGAVYSEEEWKSSEFFREGLKFDQGMTEGQARLLAERFDQIRRHEDLMSRTSLGGTALGFGGYLVGSIPDPINFIPWLGLVKKGKQIQWLIKATSRGKRALRGVAEGAVGATAFQPLYAMKKGAYQEEYDIQMALMDITLSAGIGGAFGGLFGKIHPKDPEFPSATPVDSAPLSHVPLEDRLNAARVAHAEFKATGEVTGAAKVMNDAEVEPVTLEPGTTKAQAEAKLAGAPSGVLKGSFVESKLLNPDGSLMTVYHGTVQRPLLTRPEVHKEIDLDEMVREEIEAQRGKPDEVGEPAPTRELTPEEEAHSQKELEFYEDFYIAEGGRVGLSAPIKDDPLPGYKHYHLTAAGENIGKVILRDTENMFNVLHIEIFPEWRGRNLGLKWLDDEIFSARSRGIEPTLEMVHNPKIIEWAKEKGGILRGVDKKEGTVDVITFQTGSTAKQFETILPGRQTGGLISFTTDPEIAAHYAGGSGYANIARGEMEAAYSILTDDFPDVFLFDRKRMTSKVLKPERIGDADVQDAIWQNDVRDKYGSPIETIEKGNTIENTVKELEEGFYELASGGVIYPRFLNVKNPYPKAMDYLDAQKRGAEWFKDRGYDAVWSTEAGGGNVIFTVDPTQSKSIYDSEFTRLNEGAADTEVTPVSDEPLKSTKELDLEEEIADQNLEAMGDRLSDEDVKEIVNVEEWSNKVDKHAQAYRLAGHCVLGA